MELKGAIFDMDGTLLDSMCIWHNVASKYIINNGKIPEENLDYRFLNMSFNESSRYIHDTYGIGKDFEDVKKGINQTTEDFYFHEARPKPGIPELLEKLKQNGVKMAVATATDRYLTEGTLKRNGILHYFCDIETSSEVGSGKQNPEIYNRALQAMGVKRENTIVFEDLLLALNTAKKAGFMTAGIYEKSYIPDQPEIKRISDWYITDYYEFSKVIFK